MEDWKFPVLYKTSKTHKYLPISYLKAFQWWFKSLSLDISGSMLTLCNKSLGKSAWSDKIWWNLWKLTKLHPPPKWPSQNHTKTHASFFPSQWTIAAQHAAGDHRVGQIATWRKTPTIPSKECFALSSHEESAKLSHMNFFSFTGK